MDKINEDTEFLEVQAMIRYLLKNQMISAREAALLIQTASSAYENLPPESRVQLIRSLFITLENFS